MYIREPPLHLLLPVFFPFLPTNRVQVPKGIVVQGVPCLRNPPTSATSLIPRLCHPTTIDLGQVMGPRCKSTGLKEPGKIGRTCSQMPRDHPKGARNGPTSREETRNWP